MKKELLLNDLSGLQQIDFDFKFAYTSRETDDSTIHLVIGLPLEEVLIGNKVCLNGYLISKFGLKSTDSIYSRYDVDADQWDCICMPNSVIHFNDGTTLNTPPKDATLATVLNHLEEITKDKRWIAGEFFIDTTNSGIDSLTDNDFRDID